MSITRDHCLGLDHIDPLAGHRSAFALPDGVVYLDGNSLGALPASTPARLREVVEGEWGRELIDSWNAAGWLNAPRRVGAKISRLIGADENEVICADSTSINLYKVLIAALHLHRSRADIGNNHRHLIVSERGNFPTDIYVAQAVADADGECELVSIASNEIAYHIDDNTAVLLLTHVDYRNGNMHDMDALTRRAQFAGALTVWDLAHSAGAVPVDLNGANADFAVGCGYKYLNGGPGAPGYVFVAQRHLRALAGKRFAQPLAGWFSHRAPFDFAADYQPARTIDRFAVGTPSIIGLAALECGVDSVLAAGVDDLRAKSLQQTQLFIDLIDEHCEGLGLQLVTPRDGQRRGSHVSFRHEHAWPVMQALIARGIIGDFRPSDAGEAGLMRFGFAPLYVRFVDVWDAVEQLRDVLVTRAWDRPQFREQKLLI